MYALMLKYELQKSQIIMGEKRMILHISDPYLWLPINKKKSRGKTSFLP